MQLYVVKRGDTLGKIAGQFYGSTSQFPLIVAANRIADPDSLKVGQRLNIPDAGTATSAFIGAPAEASAVTAAPAVLGPATMNLNSQRLARVHAPLAQRALRMVDLCAQAGVAVLVTQGLRTWEEQDALFAQGRTTPGKVVTNARGGESWQNFGLAFDIVVLDSVAKADWDTSHPGWIRAAGIGKSLGLEWGGDWKGFKDLPHFQHTGDVTLAVCRKLFPQGLEAIWERVA
jgi:peptidoglycan L-alanyl-D-glutamate endopeptidase CwlK